MYEIKLLHNGHWFFVARFKTPSQAKDKIQRLIMQGHNVDNLQLIKRRKARAYNKSS